LATYTKPPIIDDAAPRSFRGGFLTDSMANWPRISEGFDLMLKQYPDSGYLMNGYAHMACRAEDSEKYQALNAKLKDRLSSTA